MISPALLAALLSPIVPALHAAPTASQSEPAAAAAQTAPAEPEARKLREDPTLASDLALLARLDVPFDAPKEFKRATVREVLDEVQRATGIEVEVDRQVVGESGGWAYAQLDARAITPRQALDAAAAAISTSIDALHLDVAAGLPIFTDNASAARLAAVRHYDLRPLLAKRDTRDLPLAAHVAEIKSLIESSVDPSSWKENGGEVGWTRPVDGNVVVCTTPARHHAIVRLLEGLAASLPSQTILWSVRIAEIAPEVSAQDLAVILDSARELDALVAAKGAKILLAPRLLSARDRPAKVDVSSGADAIECTVTPVEGTASFAVELGWTKDGAKRTLTLRALEAVRAAGVLDDGSRRVLLEVVGQAPAEPGASGAGVPGAGVPGAGVPGAGVPGAGVPGAGVSGGGAAAPSAPK